MGKSMTYFLLPTLVAFEATFVCTLFHDVNVCGYGPTSFSNVVAISISKHTGVLSVEYIPYILRTNDHN